MGLRIGRLRPAGTSTPVGFSLQYALYQQTAREIIGGFKVDIGPERIHSRMASAKSRLIR